MVWQFNRGEQIKTGDGKTMWSARQHHDWQRDDFPAGYYSPAYTPSTEARTTLILAHADRMQPKVTDVMLGDDRLIEVNDKGDIVREWLAGDYIDQMGFAPDARAVIRQPRRSTRRAAASTGCTSTRRPTSGRTSGPTKATCASPRTTSSSAVARPA